MYHTNSFDAGVAVVLTVCFGIILLAGLLSVALYVLRALSLYTIAKRRGLKNAWLSWIPVGQDWILGNVSDQYKYLVQGKNQSWRKILLALSAAGTVCAAVALGMTAVVGINLVVGFRHMSDAQMASILMAPVLGLMLVALVSMVVNVAAFVFRCLCKYDLYRSCDPKNAMVFLVIGILFGVTDPFFLLSCRKKDLGMPPRRPDPESAPFEAPTDNPVEHFEE